VTGGTDTYLPVSVVVPLHSAAPRHLKRLGASLAEQGAGEVIVVIDDDSAPADVAAALAVVPNLRVLVNPGSGAGMARNHGAAAAGQPWLTFLDHDDWWPSEFLAQLLSRARSRVVGYDSELYSEQDEEAVAVGETLFERAQWRHESIDARHSRLLFDGFPLVKLLLRREAFAAVGGFRPIYAVEDFDLVWRLIAAGEQIDLVREPAGAYLVHPGSTTGTVLSRRDAYEKAQRSWVRIWAAMSRAGGLPPQIRIEAGLKAARVWARIIARRVRDRLRG
jgi:GT2 family glycosyltransferase